MSASEGSRGLTHRIRNGSIASPVGKLGSRNLTLIGDKGWALSSKKKKN